MCLCVHPDGRIQQLCLLSFGWSGTTVFIRGQTALAYRCIDSAVVTLDLRSMHALLDMYIPLTEEHTTVVRLVSTSLVMCRRYAKLWRLAEQACEFNVVY